MHEIAVDDEIFSTSTYALPIPAVDGLKAEKITVRFVGVVDLGRTSEDELTFVEALRLGSPVRLVVTGSVSGKGFVLREAKDGDECGYYCSVRIADVEIGEAA